MLYCNSCNTEVAPTDRFCGTCGSPQDSATPAAIPSTLAKPETENEKEAPVRIHVSQILCVVWIAAATGWIVFCDWSGDWILLLGPSMIACIWPILRQRRLTAWTERLEGRLHSGLERAEAIGGKIATYLVVPFFVGSLWVWTKTQRLRDGHTRAGLRAGTVLYLGALMCVLGLLVAYLFMLAILLVVALIFALLGTWIVFRLMTHQESYSAPRRSPWHGIAKDRISKSIFESKPFVRDNRSSRSREYAHNKGAQDYSRSGGQVNSNPATEFVHPTYDPPSGYEKEYAQGWKNAKKQDK